MNLKLLAGGLEDVGQTIYVVDSDFRTQAQGWTRSDRTGPLDLFAERNAGYVFRTSDYASDAAAMQAAIDAAVDFRGDKVLLTPGSYTPATALTLDADGLRLVGPPSNHPKAGRVTVTAGVDAAYTVSADDVEIGHHTMVPLTAKNFIDLSSGADRGHLHHLYYNATGITGSTSTEFCNGTTNVDWLVEKCAFYVDAAQGDAFTLTSPQRWTWQDCDFTVGLTGIAWATVFTFVTSALGNVARRLMFTTAGGATPAVFTKIFTGIANVNGQLFFHNSFLNGTALAADGDIETTFGTTTDIDISEVYYSGDATTEGGVLAVLD
jgi:hypothetical protein